MDKPNIEHRTCGCVYTDGKLGNSCPGHTLTPYKPWTALTPADTAALDEGPAPCPCGSHDVGGASGIVHCYVCKEQVTAATTADAVRAWNERAAAFKAPMTFEEWAADPVRAEKIPLAKRPNGAYADVRAYLIHYGWQSALKHGARAELSEQQRTALDNLQSLADRTVIANATGNPDLFIEAVRALVAGVRTLRNN
jgi:hypothetical protein